jgi:hypothetical protein
MTDQERGKYLRRLIEPGMTVYQVRAILGDDPLLFSVETHGLGLNSCVVHTYFAYQMNVTFQSVNGELIVTVITPAW